MDNKTRRITDKGVERGYGCSIRISDEDSDGATAGLLLFQQANDGSGNAVGLWWD